MRAGLTTLTGTPRPWRKVAKSRPQLPVASMQACTGGAGSGRCLASQASNCPKPASVFESAAWRARVSVSETASNRALLMSRPTMSMVPGYRSARRRMVRRGLLSATSTKLKRWTGSPAPCLRWPSQAPTRLTRDISEADRACRGPSGAGRTAPAGRSSRPPSFGPGRRAVERGARPVELPRVLQALQQGPVQRRPHAHLLPITQATPA